MTKYLGLLLSDLQETRGKRKASVSSGCAPYELRISVSLELRVSTNVQLSQFY